MPRQISGRPDGSNPLIYTGSVPNMVTMNRRPSVQDGINWPLGYWWIIPKDTTFTTGEVWILVSVAQSIATWKRLHGSGGTAGLGINKMFITTVGAGTYVPTSGMTQCYVECIGGGGGSSGFDASSSNGNCDGSGGGAYSARMFTATQIGASQSYSVGSGGAGGIGGAGSSEIPGSNGGDTTFGSFLVAGGGVAGFSTAPGTGGIATGGDININGQMGEPVPFPSSETGTKGGSSLMGFGGGTPTSGISTDPDAKYNGNLYGGGASGCYINTGSAFTGASGAQGIIIITEYLA